MFKTAGTASTEYGAAQLLLSAISIGYNFEYTFSVRTTVGVAAAMTVFNGLVNSLSTRWLERLTKGYVIFHLAIVISACITLLAVTKHKHNASYVFTHVENASGWKPDGFAFLFGFLSVAYTMTDYGKLRCPLDFDHSN